jgi:hypothetical protein
LEAGFSRNDRAYIPKGIPKMKKVIHFAYMFEYKAYTKIKGTPTLPLKKRIEANEKLAYDAIRQIILKRHCAAVAANFSDLKYIVACGKSFLSSTGFWQVRLYDVNKRRFMRPEDINTVDITEPSSID